MTTDTKTTPKKIYKEAYIPGAPRRARLFPKRLSESLAFPVAPALKKRGFENADILRHWDAIVGHELGRRCRPVRLTNGTLYLHTSGVWALEVQHMASTLLERLAMHYGYRIANRIVIQQ